jgi:hypothetical protein
MTGEAAPTIRSRKSRPSAGACRPMMDPDLYNRAELIQQRVVQLRDSL